MSEPDLIGHNDLEDSGETDTAPTEEAEMVKTGEALTPSEGSQLERMLQLERALEQSLTSLSELKQKLKDQHLLETQLAATEEIANIQQQAITELQRQVAQQQQSLNSQMTVAQAQEQVFQTLLTKIETIAETQQSQIGHLKDQLAYARADLRNEKKQLEQQLQERQIILDSQQQKMTELEFQILALHQDLLIAQTQITELEAQREEQQSAQVLRQSNSLELATERDRALNRVGQLEEEIIVLQARLLTSTQIPKSTSSIPLKHRPLRVDLPDFLRRQRHSQSHNS